MREKIEKIREGHFKNFEELSAEEQISWALSQGYTLWGLMSKENRVLANQLRHRPKSEEGIRSTNRFGRYCSYRRKEKN